MNSTAKNIIFDKLGVCNFCTDFLERSKHILHEKEAAKQGRLSVLVQAIKKDGQYKPYDCIVGISGGVDSSWVLVQAVELGLRPLPVHMDNGWNSELAQNNISNLVQKLNLHLYTHVIDWVEYKALMQAFFDADVIDVELLYDNAMLAVCYEQARKFGVKYILAGTNMATEGMRMPDGWNWYKRDVSNIKGLAEKFGNVSIKSFPTHSTIDYIVDEFLRRIRWISFLDYFNYNKFDALNVLERDYGYKKYQFKHYESIFTRFYQGYILPRKFNVDKRLLHLSTLLVAGQISRDEAMDGLKGVAYLHERDMDDDVKYFLKKMGWSQDDLNFYIGRPEIAHDYYKSEKWFYDFLIKLMGENLKLKMKKWLQR
jgi:N-acetyl sugar amidotransferase